MLKTLDVGLIFGTVVDGEVIKLRCGARLGVVEGRSRCKREGAEPANEATDGGPLFVMALALAGMPLLAGMPKGVLALGAAFGMMGISS